MKFCNFHLLSMLNKVFQEDEWNGYENYENTEIIPSEILKLENLDENVETANPNDEDEMFIP